MAPLKEIVNRPWVVDLRTNVLAVGIGQCGVLANVAELAIEALVTAALDIFVVLGGGRCRLTMVVARLAGEACARVERADRMCYAIMAVPELLLRLSETCNARLAVVTCVGRRTNAVAVAIKLGTGARVAFDWS